MPPGAPKSTKRTPKTPPGAPKRSPREPPNTRKSIIRSQTLIFRKSSPRRSEIKVLDGGRDNLGAQNQEAEAPREGKERWERRGPKSKRKKHANRAKTTSNGNVFHSKKRFGRAKRSFAVRMAECAGPPGRIIGGVRRVMKRNLSELALN